MAKTKMKSVLIVEDDSNLLNLAATYLSNDMLVFQAADGEEGLRLARQELPNVLVLDMMLPGVSGRDVLHELQKEADTKKIPVIILSAFNFTPEEVEAIEAEPNVKALLRKPFGFDKLLQRINALLDDPARKEKAGPEGLRSR